MLLFKLCIQNPFQKGTQETPNVHKQTALEKFQTIDWERWNKDSFNHHDDVIEDYYFYEIIYTDAAGQKHTLNISGCYTYGEDLEKHGIRLTVHHLFPQEKTTRGFLGLGSPRTKIVEKEKVAERCTKPYAVPESLYRRKSQTPGRTHQR